MQQGSIIQTGRKQGPNVWLFRWSEKDRSERTLVLVAASTGLRQSELFGLKWRDVDFQRGELSVVRSIVFGVVGRCKTESSQKPVPLHPLLGEALLNWKKTCKFTGCDDWIFASRLHKGRRPYWGASILRKYVRPVAESLNIQKYLADEKIRANADALTFDFDRDPGTLARARKIYDATSLDLRAFKARGGKLLLWHGWADGAIMATSSIGYYEDVMKFMGGRKQTEDFFRLFLVPGVHHSGGGPGFTEFDSMTALENWVEKGQAPDKLIAGKLSNGNVERTRPVFPYPILPRYSGTGDPKRAESFVSFDPSQP